MSIATELEAIFDNSFPTETQEALIKSLFAGYKAVYEHCKDMPREEAHDLLPFERWVQIRIELRAVGDRFQQLEATTERNGTSNSYHVKITAGRRMFIACFGRDSVELPGFAVQRGT